MANENRNPVNAVASKRLQDIATDVVATKQLVLLSENFGRVSAGRNNSLDLPLDYAYQKLLIQTNLSASEFKTKIDKIVLRVNGKPEVDATGYDYFTQLEEMGYELKDGLLPFVFNPFMTVGRTVADETLLTMGTIGLNTLQLVIVPKAGEDVDFVDVMAFVEPNRTKGAVMTIKSDTFSGISAGTETSKNVNMGAEDGHLLMLRIKEREHIKTLDVKYRNVNPYEVVTPEMLDELNENQVLAFPTKGNEVKLNFCRGGRLSGLLEAQGGLMSIRFDTKDTAPTAIDFVQVRVKAI